MKGTYIHMLTIAIMLCGHVAPALVTPAARGEGEVSYRTVVLGGEHAPGTAERFIGFYTPVINNSGQVAFCATLSDYGKGIWSEGSGTLALVARHRDHAPGTPEDDPNTPEDEGVYFTGLFRSLGLNDAGQTAFYAELYGAGVNVYNDSGIWSEGSGTLELVIREGDPAPGTVGEFGGLGSRRYVAFNDAGQTAFVGAAREPDGGPLIGYGVWSEGTGTLDLVALTGDPAPDPRDGEFERVGYGDWPVINAAGLTAFAGQTINAENPCRDMNGVSAIWSGVPGSLTVAARCEDLAPGTDNPETPEHDPAQFHSFRRPAIGDAGQIAFLAELYLDSPGVDELNRFGIWAGWQLVARRGIWYPGFPENAYFSGLGSLPLISGAGDCGVHTVFYATLYDPNEGNRDGIWVGTGAGALTPVAQQGEPAPGTDGAFWEFDTGVTNVPAYAINSAGHVAFRARVGYEGPFGLWAQATDGELTLIVFEDEPLDAPGVDPNETVANQDFFRPGSGGEDGRPRCFNDQGELAFYAWFGGTSGKSAGGVFVATVGVADGDSDVTWHTIDGGGERSTTGGNLELCGTIAQPDAGYMSGGSIELAGGFWVVGRARVPEVSPSHLDPDDRPGEPSGAQPAP